MKKKLLALIFALSLGASDFQFPVLDPMGVLPASALTTLAQESGVFYNPALAAFNFPSLQYTQGFYSMDCSGLFSYLKKEEKPGDEVLQSSQGKFSYVSFTRNVYISGRGGAFGYIYFQNLNLTPEEDLSGFHYAVREEKQVFFSKAYFLKANRIFMGITTKYVFYENREFSLPLDDERNYAPPVDLLSLQEGEPQEGKKVVLDLGFAGFLTPKMIASLSLLNLPITKGEKFTPEYVLGALSYKLSNSLYISAGADVSSYKNRYFFSGLFDIKILSLGFGIRNWDGEKFYGAYGAFRYKRLSLRAGLNLKEKEKAGFLISLAITNAF